MHFHSQGKSKFNSILCVSEDMFMEKLGVVSKLASVARSCRISVNANIIRTVLSVAFHFKR